MFQTAAIWSVQRNTGHSGALALSPERQSAECQKLKMAG